MMKKNHIIWMLSALTFVIFIGVAVMPPFSPPLNKRTLSADLPHIASLDYCADQYVLSLADPGQIVAVSKEAEDLHSFYRLKAKGIPKTNSTISEVISLKTDLALQTYSMAPNMSQMTERVGIKLIETTYGDDVQVMFDNLNFIGQSIRQEVRAKEMIGDFKERLKQVETFPRSTLKVAYITPSGFSAGTGTFVDEILKLSGFDTYAGSQGYKGWFEMPLEALIINPPDVIVTSFYDTNLAEQSNWSSSRHDSLLGMMNDIPTINLPGRYMACNGLFLIEAAEYIHGEATDKGIFKLASGDLN